MQTDATNVNASKSGSAIGNRSSALRITVPNESSFSMAAVVPITHNFDAHPRRQLLARRATSIARTTSGYRCVGGS